MAKRKKPSPPIKPPNPIKLLGTAPVASSTTKVAPSPKNVFTPVKQKFEDIWEEKQALRVEESQKERIGKLPGMVSTNPLTNFKNAYQAEDDKYAAVAFPRHEKPEKVYNYEDPANILRLKTGKFNRATVPKPLIKDLYKAAKETGIPPMDLIALAGQENTFGGALGSAGNPNNKRDLISGHDLGNEYEPKSHIAFFADKKLPGVAVIKSSIGWHYRIDDEDVLRKHLDEHPELLEQYNKVLAAQKKIPKDWDVYKSGAERIKKHGIQQYNANDPNYKKDVLESKSLLEQDPVLQGYLKELDQEDLKKPKKAFEEGGILNQDIMNKNLKPAPEYFKSGGIHIKKSHRGLLHKNLGVAKGKKIPASKLKIHAGDSAALKKRKQFAINAKKWHHQDGGVVPDPKQRFGAGTDTPITREEFEQFENNALPLDHPFNNLLPGHRKQVLKAFREDPNLSEVAASTMNLGMMPRATVNGKADPYAGSLGTNTEQFYLTGQKYNKKAVAPIQPDTIQQTPAPVVPIQQPVQAAPVQVPATATLKTKAVIPIKPPRPSNKKYKPTDPYAAYPRQHRKKMGYQEGGFSGAPPASVYNPNYLKLNPNTSLQQNLIKAQLNQQASKSLQTAVRGSGVVPQLENDISQPMSVMPGGVINRYANLKPQMLTTADSVYNASTAYINKYKGQQGYEVGGLHLSPEAIPGYTPGDATITRLNKGFQVGGIKKGDVLMDKQAQDSIINAYGQKLRLKKAAVRDSLVNQKAIQDARIKTKALKKGLQKGGSLPNMSYAARQKAIYEPNPMQIDSIRAYSKKTPPAGVSQKVFNAHKAVSKFSKKKFQEGGYTDMNAASAELMQANTYPVKPKKNKYLKKGYQMGGMSVGASWQGGGKNAAATGAGLGAAGTLVDTLAPVDKYGTRSSGADIGGGALKGASMGMSFGPWGALIGAAAGAVIGGIKHDAAAKKKRKALEGIARAQNAQNAAESTSILANYDNMGTGVKEFAKGGTHPHGGLHPATQPKTLHGYLVSTPGGYGNDGTYHFTDRSFLVERDQDNKNLKAGYQKGGEKLSVDTTGLHKNPYRNKTTQELQSYMKGNLEYSLQNPSDSAAVNKQHAKLKQVLEYKKQQKGKAGYQMGGMQNGGVNVDGGNLQPISNNAYEVKGDNPQATDDVQYQDAYVDHGEVLKPGQGGTQIFSDHLKVPGTGRTFAKEAKKLEKSKSIKGNPNPNQDALIESKLKALFHTQQRLNDNSQGESTEEAIQPAGESPGRGMSEGNMFRMGGVSPINVTYHDINPARIGSLAKKAMATGVMSKKYYNAGGMAEKVFKVPGFKKELRTEPGHGKGSGTFLNGGGLSAPFSVDQTGKNYLGWGSYKPISNPAPTGQPAAGRGSNIDWNQIAGLTASLASNAHNAVALKNMPDVAQVSLTRAPKFKKMDYSDQKAMLREGLNTAIKAGNRNSTMRQAQEGSQAASLSEYSRGVNQMHGDINRTNAQIGNEEAAMGWRNDLMNNQLSNQYRQDQQSRLSAIMSGESANLADVGNKMQGFIAQGNAMKLDQQKLDMNLAQLELSAPGAGYRHLIATGYTPEEARQMMARTHGVLRGEVSPQGKRFGGFVPTKKPLSYKMGGGLRRLC